MSILAPSSPFSRGEGHMKVEQNGVSSSPLPPEQAPGTPTSVMGTSMSTPGIVTPAMIPGQVYPTALAKHLEVVASRELFLDTLNKFHTSLGTRLAKKGRKGRAAEVQTFQESLEGIPKMGGKDLDLHVLYVEVTARGGLQQVIKDRKWKEITGVFNFPRTTTSASYVLRKYYIALLHHYEQAYFFGATGTLIPPPIPLPAPSPVIIKTSDQALPPYPILEAVSGDKTRKRKNTPIQILPDPAASIGHVVTGAIEGKFEHGYLVAVMVGTEKLRGVLYHVPPGQRALQHASVPNYAGTIGAELQLPGIEARARRKRRRKEDMPKKDPNAPRPNRTGYNFFFAEQRTKLKALHPEKDKELSRMIGNAWNGLSEEEKSPYQDRGVKDKERYKIEMRDYRERLISPKGDDGVLLEDKGEAALETEHANDGSHDYHVTAMDADLEPSSGMTPQQSIFKPVTVPEQENDGCPLPDVPGSPYVPTNR